MIKKSRYESGWYFFSFVYNDVTSSKIDPKQSPRASHYRSKANLTHLFHLFKLLNRRSSKFDIKWRYYNYNCHFSCTYNLYWPHICCTVRLNSFSTGDIKPLSRSLLYFKSESKSHGVNLRRKIENEPLSDVCRMCLFHGCFCRLVLTSYALYTNTIGLFFQRHKDLK